MQNHYSPPHPNLYTLPFVSQCFGINQHMLNRHIKGEKTLIAKPEILYCLVDVNNRRSIKVTTAKNFLIGYVLNRKRQKNSVIPNLRNAQDIDDYLQFCIANKVPHLTKIQMDLYNRNYSIRS